MSTHRVLRRAPERCPDCKSEDLWSGWFDADDLAVSHDVQDGRERLVAAVAAGVRWTTFCQQCGSEVK